MLAPLQLLLLPLLLLWLVLLLAILFLFQQGKTKTSAIRHQICTIATRCCSDTAPEVDELVAALAAVAALRVGALGRCTPVPLLPAAPHVSRCCRVPFRPPLTTTCSAA